MSFLVRTLSLCLVLTTIFLSVSPFSHSLVAMSSLALSGVHRMNRLAEKAEHRLENFYYEALPFSRHDINLEFHEENLKPERLTKAPGYASIDPSTMRICKWYQESTREDDDPHSPSSIRVKELTGAERMSYQVSITRIPFEVGKRCLVPLLTTIFHKHAAFFSTIWVPSTGRMTREPEQAYCQR